MKTLIVDDEVDICKRLHRELKKVGFEVEYATSPVGVIERLHNAENKEKPYELLLLDLRMPKVNGLELLKKIKEVQLDLDVIIITGYGDEDKAIESIRLGAVDYLRKPISLEELHTAIFRVWQKRVVEGRHALRHSILVMDDEEELCARIKRELEKGGYQVAIAYNGVDGLEYFKNNRVDVALVDIKMPKMSGIEMLKRCQEITNDFVSIIITGHGDHETAIEALKLGVYNYLKKPISLEELVVSVDKGIDLILLRRGLLARRRGLELETAIREQYAKNLEEMIKESTKVLRESEERYRSLVENIDFGITLIDTNCKIIMTNAAHGRLFHKPVNEFVGKECFREFEKREAICSHCPGTRAMATRRPAEVETEGVRDDGSCFSVQIHAFPVFGSDGGVSGFIEVVEDITERKRSDEALRESEEKYRSLFEDSKDVVYISTIEGKFLDINSAGVELFGYDSKEEILRIDIAKDLYLNPYDRKKFIQTMEQQGFVKDYELLMKRKDGEILTLLVTATPYRDKNGATIAYRGILRDVTQQRKLEQQLLQAQKMESVGQLAGGVAHDFNNILTAIIGYGNLIKMKTKEGDPLRHNADQILASSERAANLIQRLLAFSRKQIIDLKPVRLNEIIKRIEKLLSRVIREDIELKAILSDEDLVVMADSGQIEQVLMNLATNARDAMPDGGSLTVETETVEMDEGYIKTHGYGEPGMYALISFTDTGAGMDERTRERIFEPFFTNKEVGKGTGLGLSIVYGIIKQHNGYINVYSESDKGTTFKIYLPLTKKEVIEIKPSEPAPPLIGGTETVLLAEDDTDVRTFTKAVLEEFGYTVVEAVDGRDAIDKFMENKYKIELLLLDVIMPKKNGKEVYEEIRKVRPDMKALFMSGYTANMIHKEGIIEEGLEFVLKPISPTELLRKIRGLLEENKNG